MAKPNIANLQKSLSAKSRFKSFSWQSRKIWQKSRLERATKLQIKPPAKNGSGNYRSFCFWTSWWRLAAAFDGLLWNLKKSSFPGKVGRHLIDRISDWLNPRGFTKGVLFVRLNRYVQVDQMPFGQSEIRSIRVLWCGPFQFVGTKFNRKCFIMLEIKALFMWPDSVKICSIALKTCQGGFNILPNTKSPPNNSKDFKFWPKLGNYAKSGHTSQVFSKCI